MAPVLENEGPEGRALARTMNKKFIRFIWLGAAFVGISGCVLITPNPIFFWVFYHISWSFFLCVKIIAFLFMLMYAYRYSRMIDYLDRPSMNGGYDEKTIRYRKRVKQVRTLSIIVGTLAFMFSAAMIYFG